MAQSFEFLAFAFSGVRDLVSAAEDIGEQTSAMAHQYAA
jgi:hypothetical protein